MERDFKGIWISKEIWLSQDLSLIEKVFLVEIDSLDNEQGCFASNQYFADFFNLTPVRCSQIIKSLEKKNMITIEYQYNGGVITKRTIKIKHDRQFTMVPVVAVKQYRGIKKSLTGYKENFNGGIKKSLTAVKKNFKENNTCINNTLINNTKEYIGDSADAKVVTDNEPVETVETDDEKTAPPSKNKTKKSKAKKQEPKQSFGEFGNVQMTLSEYEKLKQDFPDVEQRIQRLDDYLATRSDRKYKNHATTIRVWARRDKEPGNYQAKPMRPVVNKGPVPTWLKEPEEPRRQLTTEEFDAFMQEVNHGQSQS